MKIGCDISDVTNEGDVTSLLFANFYLQICMVLPPVVFLQTETTPLLAKIILQFNSFHVLTNFILRANTVQIIRMKCCSMLLYKQFLVLDHSSLSYFINAD